jgi:hypothetical protein
MRRWNVVAWILAAVLVVALGNVATRIGTPTYNADPETPWINAGSITESQATLAVTARGFTAVWTTLSDAKTVKIRVPDAAYGAKVRFQTNADGDVHVVEGWSCRSATSRNPLGSTPASLADHFKLGAVFTLTGGTQTGQYSNVFVDTLTVVDGGWQTGTVYNSATDNVVEYGWDLMGDKYLVFIATTLQAGATLYVDVTWLY